jgi:serine O-acetyltransferase
MNAGCDWTGVGDRSREIDAELRVNARPTRTTLSTNQDWNHEMFVNLREDWVTYERDITRQGLWVMAVYRFGRWRYGFRYRCIRAPLSFIYKILFKFIQIVTGIELPCETSIGHRFRIDHFGGVIISGDVVFGDDVVIRNGVTIGLRRSGVRGSPKIGSRVDIGAGAKILGEINIGDDTAIGANAVVLQDVPPDSIAIGIPARIIPRQSEYSVQGAESIQRLSQP